MNLSAVPLVTRSFNEFDPIVSYRKKGKMKNAETKK